MEEGKINWQRLMLAITYYNANGYKYIDLDWTVDKAISDITKPLDKKDFFINDKVLVASAEQSFLQIIKNNKLKPGKYCGITPCFRDEIVDDLHSNYFMKVELIDTLEPNINGLNKMIKCAKLFFEEFIKTKTIELAEELYDIETLSGIELGSYGTRRTIAGEHVFGTGLAEPRLTKAIIRDDNL
jgi:seryl-tRNA synthetase